VNSLPKTATRQRRDCDLKPSPSAPESSTLTTRLPSHPHKHCRGYYASRPRGHTGIVRSVRLSVPWRSCLGYRHAGCLQLSHRRPPEMCGLRTRPRTDVDPPRFLDRTGIGVGISSRHNRDDTFFLLLLLLLFTTTIMVSWDFISGAAARSVQRTNHGTSVTIGVDMQCYA